MTATKIQPGDDLHLTSLMAPHSLNFVTGPDRAALLAYGRDVFAAAREVTVERYEIPGGMRSALEDVISYLRSHGRRDLVRLMQELYTAISPWDGGSCSDVPDALVPARPDAEYLLSIAQNHRWPMLMRAHIKAAARLTTAPALEAPAAPVGSARQFIEWMYSQPEDREPTTAEGALLEFEAHLAAAAPQAPAAPALSAAPIPVMPRAITAGLGLDDSGEEPAYCVMVAFRQEDDARYALSILSAGLGATAAPAAGNWIAAEEVDRLVRDLDVALHGEADAAPQASLCDIVGLAKAAAGKLGRPVLAAPAAPALGRSAAQAVQALQEMWDDLHKSGSPRVNARAMRYYSDALSTVESALLAAPAAPAVDARDAARWRAATRDQNQVDAEVRIGGFVLTNDAADEAIDALIEAQAKGGDAA